MQGIQTLRELHNKQLIRLGMLVERYFIEDPNTCLLKMRQLAELLRNLVRTYRQIISSEENQFDLLRRLQNLSSFPKYLTKQ